MTESGRFDMDRGAPTRARAWVRGAVDLDPIRLSEAEILVSELVGRAVLDSGADEVVVTADRHTATWSLSVAPTPTPDEITARMLDRFAARWLGPDDESRVRFEVRAPGSARTALANRTTDELLAAVEDDAEARDEVIRRLTPMAISISRRYRRKGIPDVDLEQAAVLGLVRALERYDPEAGVFERFAASTVSGEMKRLLRDRAWSVRVPRGLKSRALEASRAHQMMAQRLGRAPSASELADELDLDVDEVVDALGATSAYTSVSLDAPAPETGRTLADTLGAADDDLTLIERFGELAPAIESLPERERTIIRLRFVNEMTQTQIAERVGISQMHVSRLLRQTLGELRDRLD